MGNAHGKRVQYNIWLKANLNQSQKHLKTGCARVIWPKVIATLAMGNAHGKHVPIQHLAESQPQSIPEASGNRVRESNLAEGHCHLSHGQRPWKTTISRLGFPAIVETRLHPKAD